MIKYENEYRNFIAEEEVGNNDRVASSIDSYVNYLNSISALLNQDITPCIVKNEESIDEIIELK